ncbi:ArsR/SmtB family transcription factor [Halobacterium jilantaiense]|uniref:Transcriptional regulator, ArsR family n=1 Tax=Halobacterium jilantaiense TaxID=355548 RepID=A0A1I0NKX8_9EURY|nr:helix-turn-helix domain-containing protein [Halobacterium jilantaiense]SEW01898.1 transcriptional regulator, ArsR family [Halobacterium jilantaiense]
MTANRLLPGGSSVERGEGSEVVSIREDAADEVFEALSSGTAREILAALYEDPDTASSVADRVDTSLQNASYHIEKLVDADLVEVADTWYSEQGREMKVYAPASDSLVLFASDESSAPALKDRLLRLLGVVGILGAASFVVQRLVGGQASDGQAATTGGGEGGGFQLASKESVDANTTAQQTVEKAADSEATDFVAEAADAVAGGVPPGLLFFAGGLLMLAVVLGFSWYRGR